LGTEAASQTAKAETPGLDQERKPRCGRPYSFRRQSGSEKRALPPVCRSTCSVRRG